MHNRIRHFIRVWFQPDGDYKLPTFGPYECTSFRVTPTEFYVYPEDNNVVITDVFPAGSRYMAAAETVAELL